MSETTAPSISLYLEPLGGIAGDMTLAALLHLGACPMQLKTALASLQIEGLEFENWLEQRHTIQGMRVQFKLGQSPATTGLAAAKLLEVLDRASLESTIKQQARLILTKLTAVEAEVHGISPTKVIFHELGGWDTLADIVGVCAALASLRVQQIFCASVPLGTGWVDTAHGRMPIPAPATLSLLTGFTVLKGGPSTERTTPTGAAILAALAKPAPASFTFVPLKIGWGLGSRKHSDFPNALRATLCQTKIAPAPSFPAPSFPAMQAQNKDTWQEEIIACAETNLDNTNPEWLGWLMEKLFKIGAFDVTYSPLQMKKNRPATLLQVWYPPQQHSKILQALFTESQTLGVRYQTWQRAILKRTPITLESPFGKIEGKLIHFNGEQRFAPEFECCRQLALKNQLPLPQIYQQAQQAFLKINTQKTAPEDNSLKQLENSNT